MRKYILIDVLVETRLHTVKVVEVLSVLSASRISILANSDAGFFDTASGTVILHLEIKLIIYS